jgi:hypothetical protein
MSRQYVGKIDRQKLKGYSLQKDGYRPLATNVKRQNGIRIVCGEKKIIIIDESSNKTILEKEAIRGKMIRRDVVESIKKGYECASEVLYSREEKDINNAIESLKSLKHP